MDRPAEPWHVGQRKLHTENRTGSSYKRVTVNEDEKAEPSKFHPVSLGGT